VDPGRWSSPISFCSLLPALHRGSLVGQVWTCSCKPGARSAFLPTPTLRLLQFLLKPLLQARWLQPSSCSSSSGPASRPLSSERPRRRSKTNGHQQGPLGRLAEMARAPKLSVAQPVRHLGACGGWPVRLHQNREVFAVVLNTRFVALLARAGHGPPEGSTSKGDMAAGRRTTNGGRLPRRNCSSGLRRLAALRGSDDSAVARSIRDGRKTCWRGHLKMVSGGQSAASFRPQVRLCCLMHTDEGSTLTLPALLDPAPG